MNTTASQPESPTTPGTGRLVVERHGHASAVISHYATAPMKLLCPQLPRKPRNASSGLEIDDTSGAEGGGAAWVYVSSFGGGLVSGDTLTLDVRVGRGATAVLTTQASTKVYHADAKGTPARQTMHAHVEADAMLVVAPDPLVCFRDAVYEQSQRFDLRRGAGLVLLDWFTCGRLGSGEHGERWAFHRFASRNRVSLDGDVFWHDALVLDRDASPIDAPLSTGRFNVFATLLLVGPPTATLQEALVNELERQPLDRAADTQWGLSRRDETDVSRAHLTLRVAGLSVQAVQRVLADRLAPLTGVVGRGLWERKM